MSCLNFGGYHNTWRYYVGLGPRGLARVSAGLITVTFSALGGFKGVFVYTDFLLFFVAYGKVPLEQLTIW